MRDAAWLILLLGGVAYSVYLLLPQAVPTATAPVKLLATDASGSRPAAIDIVVRDGGERLQLSLSRSADGWRVITAENHGPAPQQIAAALDLLAGARFDREFAAPGAGGGAYGLTAPALDLVLHYPGGASARYLFGAATADGFGRYVRRAGSTSIGILPNYQFTSLHALVTGAEDPPAPD